MRETSEDLTALQELLDRSLAGQKSPNMKEIFPRQYALTADEIVILFPKTVEVAIATITPNCRPRVTPVDVLFFRGKFYHPADVGALRLGYLRSNPFVSLTYFDNDGTAVIVHGTVTFIDQQNPEFSGVDKFRQSVGRTSLRDWSPTALYVRIDATHMFTKHGSKGRPLL